MRGIGHYRGGGQRNLHLVEPLWGQAFADAALPTFVAVRHVFAV